MTDTADDELDELALREALGEIAPIELAIPNVLGALSPGQARLARTYVYVCQCAKCLYVWQSLAKRVGEWPPVPSRCPNPECRHRNWRQPETRRSGRRPKVKENSNG